jgi:hypothetical protein
MAGININKSYPKAGHYYKRTVLRYLVPGMNIKIALFRMGWYQNAQSKKSSFIRDNC